MTELSYAHGASATPLLGETIGARLRPGRGRASRAARRSSSCAAGRAPELRASSTTPSTAVAAGAAGPRDRGAAIASGSGRRTASSGCSCSTRPPRSARSSSTSTRPTARTSSSYALRQSGRAPAGQRAGVQDQRLRARWSARCAATCRRWSDVVFLGEPRVGRARRHRASTRPRWRERMAVARSRRPDQHPVHERHDRLSQGRDAHPPQHPQQRLLRRRALRLHRGRPDLRPGALLPLLRHGHGQPRRAHARGVRRRSRRRAFDPARDAARGRRPSAARRSTACRRCSSRCSATRRFAEHDLQLAAHRDHGRLAVPGRGDEARRRARCTWARCPSATA